MKTVGRSGCGVSALLVEFSRAVVQPHQHGDAIRLVAHDRREFHDVHTALSGAASEGSTHCVEAVPGFILGAVNSGPALDKSEADQQVVHIRCKRGARDLLSGSTYVEEDRFIRGRGLAPDAQVVGEELPRGRTDGDYAILGPLPVDPDLRGALPQIQECERGDLSRSSAVVQHEVIDSPQPEVERCSVAFQGLKDPREIVIIEERGRPPRDSGRLERGQSVWRDQALLAKPRNDGSDVAAVRLARLLRPPTFVADVRQIPIEDLCGQVGNRRLPTRPTAEIFDQAKPRLAVVVEGSGLRTELPHRLVIPKDVNQSAGETRISGLVVEGSHGRISNRLAAGSTTPLLKSHGTLGE